jgi:hypothetical protein
MTSRLYKVALVCCLRAEITKKQGEINVGLKYFYIRNQQIKLYRRFGDCFNNQNRY